MSIFDDYLRVSEGGRIWWRLEDAIRLGAGFRPAPDARKSGDPTLLASTQAIRANERTLLGAVRKSHGAIEPPESVDRADGNFVVADEFLRWLAQYILETGVDLEFPADLARAVDQVQEETAGRTPYKSLEGVLGGRFDGTLDALSPVDRKSVEEALFPLSWNECGPKRRKALIQQHDHYRDPARRSEYSFWWKHVTRRQAIQSEIEVWEKLSATSIAEKSEKHAAVKRLSTELKKLDQKAKRTRDLLEKRKDDAQSSSQDPDVDYYSFPQALQVLQHRHNVSAEEMAIWIWLGAKDNGLDAYRTPSVDGLRDRFHFPCWDDWDYKPMMMGCFFKKRDVDNFTALERHVSYEQLTERWRSHPGMLSVKAFIQSKVAQGALMDMHPITGTTQLNDITNVDRPPAEAAIFCLKEIERIEAEELAPVSTDEANKPSIAKAASAQAVIAAFPVNRDDSENTEWWRLRFRNAKRYNLAQCRAAMGQRGLLDSSRWYPDLVAAWLVEQKHMRGATAARLLQKHFPEHADAAERLEGIT